MTTDIPSHFPRYGAMQPFPLPCLPKPILEYVQAQSDALDCAPSAAVLPALSALASAIGCSRRIRLKPSWLEPAVLCFADRKRGCGLCAMPDGVPSTVPIRTPSVVWCGA